jgi:hypothetical protein
VWRLFTVHELGEPLYGIGRCVDGAEIARVEFVLMRQFAHGALR